MCVYVWMYVYTQVYVCVCLYTYLYVCMRVRICVCIYAYMYVCIYIYVMYSALSNYKDAEGNYLLPIIPLYRILYTAFACDAPSQLHSPEPSLLT